MRSAKYFFIFLALVLAACSKEKMDKKSLSGKWTFTSMRYVRVVDTLVRDEIINQGGYIDFTGEYPEENRGGTVYGDYASGRAKLPFIYEANRGMPNNPNFVEGKILFSKTIHEKPAITYQDKYMGHVLFAPDNVNGYTTYYTNMTMIDDKTLTLRVQVTRENVNDDVRNENGFYITLTR